VREVALRFELGFAETRVFATLQLERHPKRIDGEALRLHGADLQLCAVRLDGRVLAACDYDVDAESLTIADAPSPCTLETEACIRPQKNTRLEGLYRSGDFLTTQCEAEGFRRITWFIDRPDVMATYRVRLEADREHFPVLLANGNPGQHGRLPDGRHFAEWIDPWPKPSYLFAIVAGRLDYIEDHFHTMEGRDVRLRIYAEAQAIGRCAHAMDSLKRAMIWDEEQFGRAYDLDVFNIVATYDFNMGAMENKGLNIFNAKAIVADPETATDSDLDYVEAVVAHEYFHNWTGNRVTCRDWFQLSLKEGLTKAHARSSASTMSGSCGRCSFPKTPDRSRTQCARVVTARLITSTPRRSTTRAPRSCACIAACSAVTVSAAAWTCISSATMAKPSPVTIFCGRWPMPTAPISMHWRAGMNKPAPRYCAPNLTTTPTAVASPCICPSTRHRRPDKPANCRCRSRCG
jgi:aminopeptidase N